ncbi:nucleotidyltransferase domain-containing protein [Methanolapillus millepedarum]|uniref:Polymerase beta nucleotidyltransferase domain-containing protein n=1 Tax=Methanolapillus millepedarum TaxID=3028296 RepID=A0AA96V1W1_9EURY|nr:hypothetical protein MsAc7_04410 [Methanosarcinaceae archaeon Ac7]
MIDVSDSERKIIVSILREYVPDAEVWVYGSRYRGNARKLSDLDLTVVAAEKLSSGILLQMKEAFADSLLPYLVDISEWNTLPPHFQKIILQGHEVIYPEKSKIREMGEDDKK